MADKRLQRIMAEDERLFRAMQPGQVAKGAAAIRGSEKPSPKKTAKKKSQKRVEKGVSRFDVFSFGVVDAIQRAMAPVVSPAREAPEEVEASSDAQQGSQAGASAETFISSGYRGKESQADSVADLESRKARGDSGADNSLENPFKELPDESKFDEYYSKSSFDIAAAVGLESQVYMRDDGPDIEDIIKEKSYGSENNLGPDGARYDYRTDNLPENPFKELPEEEPEEDEPEINPLVQKRRERAESERKAAAKNFKEQQQAPILGIPNPVPMQHADQNQGVNAAANPDETALAIDESVNAASELARAMVDLMDKFSTEMTALSVRVRNLELAMDRF